MVHAKGFAALASFAVIVLVAGLVLFNSVRFEDSPPASIQPVPAEDPASQIAGLPVPAPDAADLGAIDRILASLPLGAVAFDVPGVMNLGDTAIVHVALGVDAPLAELRRLIEAAAETPVAQLRVSDRMEARLTGAGFAIAAVTPEVQAVARRDITEWKWQVEPRREGRQALHLTISALLVVDGVATPRALRSFDAVVAVDVSWDRRFTGFLAGNWQWLWATVLVPVGGWLWKRRRRGEPS